MAEFAEHLKRRERELAGGAEIPPASIQFVGAAVNRRRRTHRIVQGLGAAFAVLAVVVVSLGGWRLISRDRGPDQLPVASPTPTVAEATASPTPTNANTSASPTPTTSSSESAIIDGFAPVPHLPAEEIPWREVGPDWFLVDWRSPLDMEWVDGTEKFTLVPVDGGLSLIAPDGTWYAASTHADLPGPVLAWDGSSVWAAKTEGWSNSEAYVVDVSQVALESHSVTGSGEGAFMDTMLRTGAFIASDHSLVTIAYGGDGMLMRGVGEGSESLGTCKEFYAPTFDDMSYLLDSGGSGQLICFESADSSKTLVRKVSLDGGAAEVLTTLRLDVFRYGFVGWTDSQHFLFGRTAEGSWDFEALFEYDIATGSIDEVSLPFYLEPRSRGFFDSGSQRHVVFTSFDEQAKVSLYTLQGHEVAVIDAACPSRWDHTEDRSALVTLSGERMLVTCDALGYSRLYDTASGVLLGEWNIGAGREVRSFGFPER